MNIAIITARGGSQSIPHKNVLAVGGRPLVAYPIEAAKAASRIGPVLVSTDCPLIGQAAYDCDATVIHRPDWLSGSATNHGQVIRHAVRAAVDLVGEIDSVTVLLGNTVMVDADLIDEAVGMLADDPDATGVMSVWEAADDHPFRALTLRDGALRPYTAQLRGLPLSTNRQDYPPVYYYDQGVWTFRPQCVEEEAGPAPWWWMGERCRAIVRPWVTGRDVHSELDVAMAEWWLRREVRYVH